MPKYLKIFISLLLCFIIFGGNTYAKNKPKVFIDIGHGYKDSGAVAYGDKEKDWNLETGLACIEELEDNGIKVYTSRTDDTFIELKKRSEMANKKKCDMFVSIHYNAGNGDYGLVIGSKKNGSTELAYDIKDKLLNVRDNVKVWEDKGYYSVLTRTNMKAVIVETAFIDNKEDRKYADTLKERQEIGRQIAYGIMENLDIKQKDKKQKKDTSNKNSTLQNNTKKEKVSSKIKKMISNKPYSNSIGSRKEYVKNLLK